MNRLTCLRHAKSSWVDEDLDDHDRPLNQRGQRAAAAMATYLSQEHLIPDFILCSTSTRTRETLHTLLAHWITHDGTTPAILFQKALYMAAPDIMMEQVIHWRDHARHMMVIAHNPGLESLVTYLSPQARTAHITSSDSTFPTAAMASYELTDQAVRTSWRDWPLSAHVKLTHFRTPKDLI